MTFCRTSQEEYWKQVIFAKCNFHPSNFAVLLHLEFAQARFCLNLKIDIMGHWNSPSDSKGKNKTGANIPLHTVR